MTSIILEKQQLEGGVTHFNLRGEYLPERFLGLATEIKLTGQDLKLVKTDLGVIWQGKSIPILMAKMLGDQTLSLGLTQKASSLEQLPDGVLLSFDLQGELENLVLEKQVFSVYDQGRKDLADVKWTVKDLPAERIELNNSTAATKSVEIVEQPATSTNLLTNLEEVLDEEQTALPEQNAELTVPEFQIPAEVKVENASGFDLFPWLLALILVLVAVLVWLGIRKFPRRDAVGSDLA